MRKWGYIVMASVAALAVSACGGNTGEGTRDFIRVVGSSTVSPFAEIIAEGKDVTYDMKADRNDPTAVGTQEMAEAICKRIQQL
jgi:ABC-type phosphate transport system substrate-binding protein